jgi:hypothetical protein
MNSKKYLNQLGELRIRAEDMYQTRPEMQKAINDWFAIESARLLIAIGGKNVRRSTIAKAYSIDLSATDKTLGLRT